MTSPDLERLRFLLVAVKETEIPPTTERRLLTEFQLLWPPRKADDRAEPGEEQVGPHGGGQRALDGFGPL